MTSSLSEIRSGASSLVLDDPSENRVQGNCLAQLVDWVCSMVFELYNFFILRPEILSSTEIFASEERVLEDRVIHFSDGMPLYDRTAAKVVRIVPYKVFNLISGETTTLEDDIFIDDGKVLFSNDLNHLLIFSKEAHTDHVIVEDAGTEGVYKITEVQTEDLPQNHWIVDTKKKFQINQMGGQLILGGQPAYLIESEIPTDYASLAVESIVGKPSNGMLPRVLIKV